MTDTMPAHRLPLWVCVALAATACSTRTSPPPLAPAPAAPPPLRLEFRPPTDVALIETVKSSLRRGATSGAQEVELTTDSRFTSEQGRWLLTQRVTQASTTQDGAPVETPVDDILQRLTMKARLAADGTFVDLLNPEAVETALHEVVPEGATGVEALERYFHPEAVEVRARREWELKYGGLYGRGLSEGQKTWTVSTVMVDAHVLTYLLERTFTGTLLTEHGEAVTFALRCVGLPREDSPDAGPVRAVLEAAGRPELSPGVQCEGEQVLGRGRFLPVRRSLTVRAPVQGGDWTRTVQSMLQSLQPLEGEKMP